MSPEGRRVVYELQRTNWDENAFERELWVVDVGTGQSHRLTSAKKSSLGAAWSPDGRWIAFLSDRPPQVSGSPDGKRQIYLISADGGEATQLTKTEKGVNAFAWSPDGHHIAYAAEDSEPRYLKDRNEHYGEYTVVHADYVMRHLWMLDLPAAPATGVPDSKRLTAGSSFSVVTDGNGAGAGAFAWSPDGTRIAFAAQRDPDLISSGTDDIAVVSVGDGAMKKIVTGGGPNTTPVWSPDGKEIAFQTAGGAKYFYYANSRIAVVPAGGGTPRHLTDVFDENPALVAWASDGIYFSSPHKMERHLYRVNPATQAVGQVSTTDHLDASAFSFSKDFMHVAYAADRDNEYGEIYAAGLAPWQPTRLTAMGNQLTGFRTARREVVSWTAADGTRIEGVLLEPADFDPHKKYPLLVVIHGGPTAVDRPVLAADRYYPLERFVAEGALVLRPNYRGSAGYGEQFRSLNVRNLGVGDYADVISGVDALIAKGFVDKDRVGAMGWSQGGYISAFISASSDRFKAVSVGAGISDWMTYYVNTDITPFTPQYLHGTPWGDPEIYKKTSPITYIAKARTPTLIQHGELDRRVPIPNAYELRQALEDRGVPVKMVVYKGFGHGIDKPKQQRAVMEENEKWFGQYVLSATTPSPVSQTGEGRK
jgi:dipeptidyl aminopeptidase/acylaminoacyl peptidase